MLAKDVSFIFFRMVFLSYCDLIFIVIYYKYAFEFKLILVLQYLQNTAILVF